MILDLGQALSASAEWIRVTTEYSNAVLVAVMPYISDVAQKLELPVPHPITTASVSRCNIVPTRAVAAEVGVRGKNGDWFFAFARGHVTIVQGPKDYFALQDADLIPNYFGEVQIDESQAVEKGRQALRKLEIPLQEVFADQEPYVKGPEKIGTNVVPQYRIEWRDPRSGFANCAVDIDGENGNIVRVKLLNRILERPDPSIGVRPPPLPNSPKWAACNPEYALKLAPIALTAIGEYSQKLGLSLSPKLTTNQVAIFKLADNGGWPHAEIELTNGWRFVYRNSGVCGYYTPDNFFNSESRKIRTKDFIGEAKLSEADAIKIIRKTAARLGYSTNLLNLDFQPQILKPAVSNIPRLFFSWQKENEDKRDLVFKLEAEVDMEKGRIKSLYFDNIALWNKPPPIDVPLTILPTNKVENILPSKGRQRPHLNPRRKTKFFTQ